VAGLGVWGHSLDERFEAINLEIKGIKHVNNVLSSRLDRLEERADGWEKRFSDIEKTIKKMQKELAKPTPKPAPHPTPHPSPFFEPVVLGLRGYKFSDLEIAGLMGNMIAESGLQPDAKSYVHTVFGDRARGLLQWCGGRLDNLKKLARLRGGKFTDGGIQIEYVAWECGKTEIKQLGHSTERGSFERAKELALGSPKMLGYFIGKCFERPSAHELAESRAKREEYAEKVYNWLKK